MLTLDNLLLVWGYNKQQQRKEKTMKAKHPKTRDRYYNIEEIFPDIKKYDLLCRMRGRLEDITLYRMDDGDWMWGYDAQTKAYGYWSRRAAAIEWMENYINQQI